MPEIPPPTLPARAVLDTQVLLDWLLFDDPSVARLAAAIESSQVAWVAEMGGLTEFRHMLGHASLARYAPSLARAEVAIASHCQVLPTPAPRLHGLICRDPDDQCFIDLALDCRATWLFSRDKAVLALAKRARLKGLCILPPSRWET